MTARKLLKRASLVLNAALLIALAWMLREQAQSRTAAHPANDVPTASSPQPESAADFVRQPQPSPFRWSQLESPDYRVYIANLRRIGCPEQTIREIISADLADLYAAKRGELSANNPDATNLPPTAAAALRQLQQQQAQVVAQLLGPDAGGTPVPAAPNPAFAAASRPMMAAASTQTVVAESSPTGPAAQPDPATDAAAAKRTRPPSMPIVFSPVDPVSLGLNPVQAAAVQQIQQNFVQAIGGPNADPSDPNYLNLWNQAQPTADQMVWTLLGQQVFNAMQLTRPVRNAPARE